MNTCGKRGGGPFSFSVSPTARAQLFSPSTDLRGMPNLHFDSIQPENITMALEFTTSYLKDSIEVLRYYKRLAERAIAQLPDEALVAAPDAESNSVATIVKHLAGNMRSRFTHFLTSDGEKPDRKRDTEFEAPPKTRGELMAMWEAGDRK